MSVSFIRRYHLSIVIPSSSGGDATQITLTENQITADVSYANTKSNAGSDSHNITIYNASEGIISAIRLGKSKVILRAGYHYSGTSQVPDEQLPVLLIGDIVTSSTTRSQTETVTSLVISSNLANRKAAIFSSSFAKNSPITSVINSMCASLQAPYTVKLGSKAGVTLARQRSFSGSTTEVLQKFCNEFDLKWYNHLGVNYVVHRTEKDLITNAVTIEIPQSSIKGNIDFASDVANRSAEENSPNTVTFTTFLNPSIALGSRIKLTIDKYGNEVAGQYVVESVKHSINMYGEAFDTNIEATDERS